MSTNLITTNNTENRVVTFTPLAEGEPITLTIGLVMNQLAVKTRSGKTPTVGDVVKFMMLCKSRRLNPFVGDAYLVGYDSDDGPTFQLISAIQSLRKRAESNPEFNGAQRGVIVQSGDQITEREGTMVFAGENLVGGWGKVYRKDYATPFYETVKLSTYNTKRSRWAKDPEGMIAKVGEAAALRRAFPSDVGALYIAEEFDNAHAPKPEPAIANGTKPRAPTLDDLAAPSTGNQPEIHRTPPAPTPLQEELLGRLAEEEDRQAQLEDVNRFQEEQEARAAEAPRQAPAASEPAPPANQAPAQPPQPGAPPAVLEGPELQAALKKLANRISRTIKPAALDDIEAEIIAELRIPNGDAEDLLDLLANRRAELDQAAG